MEWWDDKIEGQVNQSYTLTLQAASKAPVIANRYWSKLSYAQAYVDDMESSAVPGLILSVYGDTDDNNGIWWVKKVATQEGEKGELIRPFATSGGGGGGGIASISFELGSDQNDAVSLDINGEKKSISVDALRTSLGLKSFAYEGIDADDLEGVLSAGDGIAYDKGKISLAPVYNLTDGDYIGVTVDKYGRVTTGKSKIGIDDVTGLSDKFGDYDKEIGKINKKFGDYVLRTDYEKDINDSETGLAARIAKIEGWFELDDNNNIRTTYNFYSTKQLASGGIGDASGSGLGLILNEWPTDSEDYSKYALGGNLGIELNTRLTAVEGKATNVTVSPTLSQGKPMGTIMVDGVSQTMYAPSRLSQMDANFVDKSLLPYDDGACSLGSASRQWTVVFAEDFEASNSVTAPLGEFGNLGAQTAVFSDLLPSSNNPGDIGGNSRWWSNVYATTINSQRISTESIDAASDDLTIGVTDHCEICFFDNYEGENFARFGYTGSHIYTDLAVDGALTVNGASVATQTWADGRYLPLSGGIINGTSTDPVIVNTTATSVGIRLRIDEANRAFVGYGKGVGAYLYTYDTGAYIGVDNSGSPFYHNGTKNTLIHSGNIGSQSVASATKLADDTAFTAWGQTFFENGKPKNVTGALKTPSGYNAVSILDSYLVLGQGMAENSKPTYLDGYNVYMRYGNSSTIGLTLNSSGNVGIGTTNPEYKLDVNGNGRYKGNLHLCTSFDSGSYGKYLGFGYHGARIVSDNSNFAESFRTTMFGNSSAGSRFITFRTDTTVDGLCEIYGNGIAWASGDTHGYLAISYGSYKAYIGGGSSDKLSWYAQLFHSQMSIIPSADKTHNIGSAVYRYANAYLSNSVRIGNAVLSWDSANNALKIEGNVYATGQVASGGIGTAVATIASDHEDRIAQLEAKVESLMS